ncbi:MAG: hypothetical protein ACLFPO_13630 [Spirochaetaceae bacterium]
MEKPFMHLVSTNGELDEDALRSAFIAELDADLFAKDDAPQDIFADALEQYEGDELAEVCGEIVQTIKAECSADDFHNWNYDHLEFIIDLSNRYGFTIPRNLLNGLPEQLIIMVDAKKLGEPGCE